MNYKIIIILFSLLFYGCDSNKRQAERKYNEGIQMFEASKYDSSIVLFQEAIKLDTSLSKARYYLAETYRKNQNYEAAINALFGIKNKSIPLDSIYALYTKIYSNKEEFDKSIEYAKKVISIKPNSAEGHLELGKAYYNKANYLTGTESLELYKKALEQAFISNEIKPNNNKCLLLRGIIRYGINDFKGALKDLNVVLKQEKKDSTNLYQATRFIGLSYEKQRNFTLALKYLDAAINFETGNSIVYFNRALVKLELKMYDQSCEDFRKAMELGETAAVDYIQIYCNK